MDAAVPDPPPFSARRGAHLPPSIGARVARGQETSAACSTARRTFPVTRRVARLGPIGRTRSVTDDDCVASKVGCPRRDATFRRAPPDARRPRAHRRRTKRIERELPSPTRLLSREATSSFFRDLSKLLNRHAFLFRVAFSINKRVTVLVDVTFPRTSTLPPHPTPTPAQEDELASLPFSRPFLCWTAPRAPSH